MSVEGMYFSAWRKGTGGRLCKRLGFDVSALETWRQLASAAARFNRDGRLFDKARDAYGVWSTGERAVLLATLHACDFTWLARELGGDSFLALMEYTYDDHAIAAVACLARLDEPR